MLALTSPAMPLDGGTAPGCTAFGTAGVLPWFWAAGAAGAEGRLLPPTMALDEGRIWGAAGIAFGVTTEGVLAWFWGAAAGGAEEGLMAPPVAMVGGRMGAGDGEFMAAAGSDARLSSCVFAQLYMSSGRA